MSKEIKLGIFGIIVILGVVFGYRFLAGENLLTSSKFYYIYVDDAKGLIKSSPVFHMGFQVGTVTDITFDYNEIDTKVKIEMKIDEPVKMNADAIAEIYNNGLIGGKAIQIKVNHQSNAPAIESGATIKGISLSMLETMIGSPDEISPYAQILKDGLVSAYDTIATQAKDPTGPGVGKMFNDADIILAQMKVTMHHLNKLIKASSVHVTAVLSDLSAVTSNLKASNAAITGIIANTQSITKKLDDAGLDSTVIGANAAIQKLEQTLVSTNTLITKFDALAAKANEGDGTLAKLLNDPELYIDLAKSVKNTNLLLQDFRLNPKRYVNVSVFGKKQKNYVVPENDPAEKK